MNREPSDESDAAQSLPFTHLDADGRARMVDVGGKAVTARRAVARGRITMQPTTLAAIRRGEMAKGDVLAVARVAGIQAAKETSRWIPLCHPIALDAVDVDFDDDGAGTLTARVETRIHAKTGIEMEALTAVSAALLTVYDMCKAVDRAMTIGPIWLDEKVGGRSGTWRRESPPA